MIETVFTLEDEQPMAPETPEEGGMEETPAAEPESRFDDEQTEESNDEE